MATKAAKGGNAPGNKKAAAPKGGAKGGGKSKGGEGGGHFLQEDRGPQLAAVVAAFVAG